MSKPSTAGVPLLRAVVVNFNGGGLTTDCLRSLLATGWPPERLQVVLVDNASGDGVVETVRTSYGVRRDGMSVLLVRTGGLSDAGAVE